MQRGAGALDAAVDPGELLVVPDELCGELAALESVLDLAAHFSALLEPCRGAELLGGLIINNGVHRGEAVGNLEAPDPSREPGVVHARGPLAQQLLDHGDVVTGHAGVDVAGVPRRGQ